MRGPAGNETVRAPPVAILGLMFLTGCVGSDPNGALHGVATSSLTTRPAPVASVAAVEIGLSPVGPMPGDLLVRPTRVVGGTDPITVLAHGGSSSGRSQVAYASPSAVQRPAPALGTPLPTRAVTSTTTPGAAPLLAAHLEPMGSSASANTAAEIAHLPATPGTALSEIETRAAAEQRLQTARDRRFDMAVRRATNLVCSGCAAGSKSSTNTRVRRAQVVAPDDEAE